ncbi:hypothetical protein VNO80_30509 [Phaseolus coccineus]|uniref:Uncharacterized protein n=1 Tax=Phaseolus coccineus TaxID=3886 RepID=A0AAN9LCX2_PHACN
MLGEKRARGRATVHDGRSKHVTCFGGTSGGSSVGRKQSFANLFWRRCEGKIRIRSLDVVGSNVELFVVPE